MIGISGYNPCTAFQTEYKIAYVPLTKAKISTKAPKKVTARKRGKYCMIKPASMMQISNMIACMVLYRIKCGTFGFLTTAKNKPKNVQNGMNPLE